MSLRSVLLKGTVDQILKYPLRLVMDITEGEWQIALSTISFKYYTRSEHQEDIPRKVLQLSSNYVITQDVNERNEVISTEAVLSTIFYGGKHGTENTIGFKNQNFFTVTNAEQELQIKLTTIDQNDFTTGASVFLLVLLRRVR